jgi:hypothetical protein
MYTLEEIAKHLKVPVGHIKNCYLYGSRVYSTHNSKSDYDYIIIMDEVDDKVDGLASSDGMLNATIYSVEAFVNDIKKHEISALECLFLSSDKVVKKEIDFTFNLDLTALRIAISSKVSNSWVKAKKKLIVAEDYNPLVAKKSVFHVFRILNFGVQIAKTGKIYDYTAANDYWNDISKLPNDWNILKEVYQKQKNILESNFRLVAPKK